MSGLKVLSAVSFGLLSVGAMGAGWVSGESLRQEKTPRFVRAADVSVRPWNGKFDAPSDDPVPLPKSTAAVEPKAAGPAPAPAAPTPAAVPTASPPAQAPAAAVQKPEAVAEAPSPAPALPSPSPAPVAEKAAPPPAPPAPAPKVEVPAAPPVKAEPTPPRPAPAAEPPSPAAAPSPKAEARAATATGATKSGKTNKSGASKVSPIAAAVAAEAASAPASAQPDEPAGEGILNLRASDTADVFLDGKKVGSSPVTGRKVKAGKHKVRFDCYDADGETKPGTAQTVEVGVNEEKAVEFTCPQ